MANPIAFQLREARLEKGVRLEDLCQLAGLKCSADSLCRKLAGKQILTTSEAEQIAQALERQIIWTPTAPRRHRHRRAA